MLWLLGTTLMHSSVSIRRYLAAELWRPSAIECNWHEQLFFIRIRGCCRILADARPGLHPGRGFPAAAGSSAGHSLAAKLGEQDLPRHGARLLDLCSGPI